MQARERRSIALLVRILALFAALLLPGMARADCPPPEIPPAGDGFYYCFDGAKIGPQPIIQADKGPFIVVEVSLNGHKLPALLDTGAEISVIDASVAKEIGLKVGGSYGITAMDGRQAQGRTAPVDELVIGGFIRNRGIVAIADLRAMRQAARQPFAMMLGGDVLSQVALFVDRDDQTLVVLPNNAKVNGSNWVAPLRLQQPGSVFLTDLSVEGHAITVRLDTGADDELMLRDTKWAGIVPPTAHPTTIAAAGVAGVYAAPLVRLNDMKIGGKPIGDAMATQVNGAASTGLSDGIIGMGILARYSLFLNPQAGVMVLTPPRKPPRPRDVTMVGIQGPPTDQGITIMHVMAHSPAEAAGLKPGDRICTVDGEKVSRAWAGTAKNEWMSGPEGKIVVLGRCGGGVVRVALRRFY